jgi:hypothetical protein
MIAKERVYIKKTFKWFCLIFLKKIKQNIKGRNSIKRVKADSLFKIIKFSQI